MSADNPTGFLQPDEIWPKDSRSLAQAPNSGLDTKLAALRYCIAGCHDEDALAHLFDLIVALCVRSAVTGVSEARLTPEGEAAMALLVPNARGEQPAPKAKTL